MDPDTGKTDVVRFTAVQDVGKAIHPSYVEGQMQGGAVQGIGWALNEEYVLDDEGVMKNSSFLDYRMPTSYDLPPIDAIMVEVGNPIHPVRRARGRRGADCAARRGYRQRPLRRDRPPFHGCADEPRPHSRSHGNARPG